MAEQLAIDLHALAAETADGNASSVDLGTRRRAVQITAKVVAIAGGVSFSARLETSADDTNWRVVFQSNISSVAEVECVRIVDRYVRAAWTTTGSVTWSMQGYAHTLYCLPSDISKTALPDAALRNVDEKTLIECCIAATSTADSWIGNAYTLPLTAWGPSLTEKTSLLAAAIVFRRRGINPESSDVLVFDSERMAIKWFERLGASKGGASPPEIVDSTPDTYEGGSFVESSPQRGW